MAVGNKKRYTSGSGKGGGGKKDTLVVKGKEGRYIGN